MKTITKYIYGRKRSIAWVIDDLGLKEPSAWLTIIFWAALTAAALQL